MILDIAKRFIKDRKAILLVIGYVSSIIGYQVVNDLNLTSVDVATAFDSKIPFIKYFVVPYYSWYFLVLFSFIYIYAKDNEEFYKFAICINLTMYSALLIYLLFQTSVTRPVLVGDDIFTNMVRSIYANDRPVNCCPSLHTAITLVCNIWVCRVSESKAIKSTVTITGYLIILSTLFIKQHVVLDVIVAFIQVFILKSIVDRQISSKKNEMEFNESISANEVACSKNEAPLAK